MTVPPFFIPLCEPKELESLYSAFANIASGYMGRQVKAPPMAERIYSVTFRHDNTDYTATVGEVMPGDRVTVLAIYPCGDTHIVVTADWSDERPSAWGNPFMTGPVHSVTYFSE